MQEKAEIIRKSIELLTTGAIWMFWGTTYYLYQVSKWQKFRIMFFIINMICAFFVGFVVWNFIPTATAYRDWLIAIWWFSAFPILDFLEKKWAFIISKTLEKWQK